MENRPHEVQPDQAADETKPAEQIQKEKKSPSGIGKTLNILGNVVFVLVLIAMAGMVFALVQSKLTGNPPAVAGYQIYIVKGGSMSPTFEAGSLAFLKPVEAESIVERDIITYWTGDTLCTHRVVGVNRENGQLSFTTRGDANDVNDGTPVVPGSIVGKVSYTVPYAGFLMDFAQTKKGLITLVMIPGALIIGFELRNLFRYAAEAEAEKKARDMAKQMEVSGEAERTSS